MEFLPRLYDNSPIAWKMFREFMNGKLKVAKIAKSHYWNLFVLFVVLVNTVIIIYYFVEDPSPEVP
jgi:phage-related minor tail protein